jgi:hypothetical protein
MSEESVDLFIVILVCVLSRLWDDRSPREALAAEPFSFAGREDMSLCTLAPGHACSIPGIAIE